MFSDHHAVHRGPEIALVKLTIDTIGSTAFRELSIRSIGIPHRAEMLASECFCDDSSADQGDDLNRGLAFAFWIGRSFVCTSQLGRKQLPSCMAVG